MGVLAWFTDTRAQPAFSIGRAWTANMESLSNVYATLGNLTDLTEIRY